MAILTIPEVGEGEALGPTKSNVRAVTSTAGQVAASEWNASAVGLAAVVAEVGLTTAPAAGSINAERLRNASEIGVALTATDCIPVLDVSDTTDHANGTVKKSLLSRVTTFLLAAIPIAYGTWTPTVTLTTNLDGTPTTDGGFYIRIGTIAFGFARCTYDATSAGAATEFRLTFPVTSNTAAAADALGIVSGGATSVGRCLAEPTSDLIRVVFTAGSAASDTAYVIVGHRVI
jgi:hypothetical protein